MAFFRLALAVAAVASLLVNTFSWVIVASPEGGVHTASIAVDSRRRAVAIVAEFGLCNSDNHLANRDFGNV